MDGGYHEISRWPGAELLLDEERDAHEESLSDEQLAVHARSFQAHSACTPGRWCGVGTMLATAVVIVVAGWLRQTQLLHVARHADTIIEVSCGVTEKDVDYLTAESLFPIYQVQTPAECRIQCEMHRGCKAWSWGKIHGAGGYLGLISTCFLKSLQPEEEPVKQTMPGFVSGLLTCPLPTTTSASTAAPTSVTSTSSMTPTATTTSTHSSSTSSSTTQATSTSTGTSTTSLTTTATTTSSTVTRTTPKPDHYPLGSIFCWSLMLPDSYEQQLLNLQWREGASIFSCDEYAIYSNKDVEVAPGVRPSIVDSDMKCPIGGEFHTALNREIFMIVWAKVIEEGRYALHDWTAKVDPDAVFFPNRLRTVLAGYSANRDLLDQESGMYLNNCQFGLHGPIEVLSRNAVRAWGSGASRCLDHFHKLCSGPCLWGEDLFMDQCLWKVLGSTRVNERRLLTEDHCAPPDGWRSCHDIHSVSFHPFKTLGEYRECLSNSMSADEARRPALDDVPQVFLSHIPVPRCSAKGQDCSHSRCCQLEGTQCYAKNKYWAECLPSCTPGIHMEEPPEVRTAWWCNKLFYS